MIFRWKLKINVSKTMILRKSGMWRQNLDFYYNGESFQIVSKFRYLSIIFTTSGRSFLETQNVLAGKAQRQFLKRISIYISLHGYHPDID